MPWLSTALSSEEDTDILGTSTTGERVVSAFSSVVGVENADVGGARSSLRPYPEVLNADDVWFKDE